MAKRTIMASVVVIESFPKVLGNRASAWKFDTSGPPGKRVTEVTRGKLHMQLRGEAEFTDWTSQDRPRIEYAYPLEVLRRLLEKPVELELEQSEAGEQFRPEHVYRVVHFNRTLVKGEEVRKVLLYHGASLLDRKFVPSRGGRAIGDFSGFVTLGKGSHFGLEIFAPGEGRYFEMYVGGGLYTVMQTPAHHSNWERSFAQAGCGVKELECRL